MVSNGDKCIVRINESCSIPAKCLRECRSLVCPLEQVTWPVTVIALCHTH